MLLNGDCREVMAAMDAASVDAICTDPPYGLEFMGKEWDRLGSIGKVSHSGPDEYDGSSVFGRAARVNYNGSSNIRCRKCDKWKWGHTPGDGGGGGLRCQCAEPDFPSVRPDQAKLMQAWHETWAREAHRVLKPGGHCLAFGGDRTAHRLVSALEDSGFEIRGKLYWHHGQGFPKSLNAEREIAVKTCTLPGRHFKTTLPDESKRQPGDHVCPITPESEPWLGWGTALKPATEEIVVARKPLIGGVAANVLAHGVGALNIDATRIKSTESLARPYNEARNDVYGNFQRFGNPHEPAGRWPANLLLSHHEDCREVGTRRVKGDTGQRPSAARRDSTEGWRFQDHERTGYAAADGMEEVAAWECVEGCPVRLLDEQSGERPSAGRYKGERHSGANTAIWSNAEKLRDNSYAGETGGASRFFATFAPDAEPLPIDQEDTTRFRYVAKSSRLERNAGLEGMPERPVRDGGSEFGKMTMWNGENGDEAWRAKNPNKPAANDHPTCKPIALMRWLVRLVTPPHVLVCERCYNRQHENSTKPPSGTSAVRDMRQDFQATGQQQGGSVLLDSVQVRGATDPEAAPVRVVSDGVHAEEGRSAPVLLQGVQQQGNGSEVGQGLSDRPEGLPAALPTRASDGEQGRLCDGASASDGRASGTIAPANGDRASSQRNQRRQPDRESATNGEVPARPDSQAGTQADHLPTLRREDRNFGTCPTCSGPLSQQPGLVLDCFLGSGTTGIAAILEGFRFVGIEQDAHYLNDIARHRIAHWQRYGEDGLKYAKAVYGGPRRYGGGKGMGDTVRRCPEHGESFPSGSNHYRCGCPAVRVPAMDVAEKPQPAPTHATLPLFVEAAD
jgi:DNA modification methylase